MFRFIRKRCYCALIFVSAATLCAGIANSATIIVRVDGQDGNTVPGPDGSDWNSEAFLYLRDAIAFADEYLDGHPSDNAQIWIRSREDDDDPLIYYPDEGDGLTDGDRSSAFNLREKLAIYGGFEGDETQISQRDPYDPAILSGDLDGDYNPADPFNTGQIDDNAFHVVYVFRISETSRLDGLMIMCGNADGSSDDGSGGGLFLLDSSTLVARCTFKHNQAESSTGQGGGAVNSNTIIVFGDPIFVSCSFVENRSANAGGAALAYGANLEFHNCVFRGNVVTGTSPNRGGAIYAQGTSTGAVVNLFNCTLYQNTATNGPSAYVTSSNGDLVAKNSILWNDSATAPVALNDNGSAVITYSDVEGGYSGTGNINANPQLNTSMAYDVLPPLYNNSPCLNKGHAADLPDDVADLDGDSSTIDDLP